MKGINTLRNLILFGFLFVMAIVLSIVGFLVFDSVSTMLKNNAEKHFHQTAVQASSQLEATIGQLDMIALQVVADDRMQRLMGLLEAARVRERPAYLLLDFERVMLYCR